MLALPAPIRLTRGAALAITLSLAACASGVRTPGDAGQGGSPIPANYPPTIVESADHLETMRAEWQRVLEAHGVPADRRKSPDLAPVTHVPESTLNVGAIPLGQAATQTPLDEERIRLLLRDFIADRAQLLGVSANTLSLESATEAGSSAKRYTYVQGDYRYPILPPDGRLIVVVNTAAEIIQLSDTAIPYAELPAEPRITREGAAKGVLGTTFTYGDIAGRPQKVTVSDPAAVTVQRLVVYPERSDQAIRIRLAWEVEAGSGMAWTVFVDAITGETIATRQNFQT
jgi:hypothetical protein